MIKVSNKIDFDETTYRQVASMEYGQEWPIVYILFNDEEAYVGETVNAYARLAQHFENPDRRKLKNVRIITDKTFNKSVGLDLESFLISHMSADGRFKRLQNSNAGQRKHDYYQKEDYEKQFKEVWEQLQDLGLANQEIHKIENSNIFKYSPYKSLSPDQYFSCTNIISTLAHDIEDNSERAFVVNGGPGTGKTILAIYLMKLLTTSMQDDFDSDDEQLVENLNSIHKNLPKLKIGLVISMTNLRNIVQKTFRAAGMDSGMVLGPADVAKIEGKFDILLIDEAHRLRTTRNAGASIGSMYETNRMLGLDEKNGTQLDWILRKSKRQIFFYDAAQSIKRTDIDRSSFMAIEQRPNTQKFHLNTQMRCAKGGQEYIDYIRAIFSQNPPKPRKFGDYDLRLFDNVREMTNLIREKDANDGLGLCRNLAGFGWEWKTNKKGNKIHPKNLTETNAYIVSGRYDIDINGEKYIWNVDQNSWIDSPNAVNEIGCVHTIQGFDLNYAGVIIGNELRYNPQTQKLEIDASNYYDANGKAKTDDESLLQYILNIYTILCTRGIYGTYIYACDPGLQGYLRKFIQTS